MKASELRELSTQELHDKLETLRRENYNLRYRSVVESIEDNSIFKKNRKDIARILTILNERRKMREQEKKEEKRK